MTATGRMEQLVSECAFAPAFDPATVTPQQAASFKQFRALWDTGASGTVISQRIVTACGLQPIGMTKTYGVGGEHITDEYLVNIGLPNKIGISGVKVIRGELVGFDALIGMNIITLGDFALTNHNGKTVFTFRFPSCETIDFVTQGIRTPWGSRKIQ
jgi:hypothetical protein